VPVSDEIEAIVLILQRRPIVQRSNEMAKMQLSCRAHARNDARLHSETLIVDRRLNDEARAYALGSAQE
jgi:hypothetical protein